MKRRDFLGGLFVAIADAGTVLAHGFQRKAIVVTHSPDPCPMDKPRRGRKIRRPHVWYYRTEVRNTLKVPVQIIKFDSYGLVNGKWVANNVMNRELDNKDFAKWYTEVAPAPDGWITPGQAAVCDPNWTWNQHPIAHKMKWKYTARDKQGKTYQAEAVVHFLSNR